MFEEMSYIDPCGTQESFVMIETLHQNFEEFTKCEVEGRGYIEIL